MARSPSVCIKAVRVALLAASARGHRMEELCRAYGLDPSRLGDPYARVPQDLILRLRSDLSRRTGDDAFGLHAAELVHAVPLDLLDHMLRYCQNMGEALRRMERYVRLLHDACTVTLSVEGGAAHYAQRFSCAPPPRHFIEFIFAMWVLRVRRFTGSDVGPAEVRFQHAPPEALGEHRRLFGAGPRFSAPENEIRFPVSLLSVASQAPDPTLCAVLERQAEELLAHLPAGIRSRTTCAAPSPRSSRPPIVPPLDRPEPGDLPARADLRPMAARAPVWRTRPPFCLAPAAKTAPPRRPILWPWATRDHPAPTGAERQFLGPQTTGRSYRNLSVPEHAMRSEHDLTVPMRDRIHLHADVHRPDTPGRFPALVAISPYPRQMQYLGVPAGLIEAGQSDLFVPRGYAHVIANCRGTGGSEGTYEMLGPAERHGLHDLIERVAAQPWCDGNVGMIGVSYFAIEQLRAAVEAPPHLRAIFPWSGTLDLYREVLRPGGLLIGRFAGLYVAGLGVANGRDEGFFRGPRFRALNRLLQLPPVHRRFERPARDTLRVFDRFMRLGYDPHPWEDIYYQIVVEHPLYDAYGRQRDLTELVQRIRVPIYLGADWKNVAMHLDTPSLALERLADGVPFRVGLTPRGGLQWPWESLHVEALAWYDHWLKGRDTGIMDEPPIRYFVEGANEWRTAGRWPPPGVRFTALHLRADGLLGTAPASGGHRDYLSLPLPSSARATPTRRRCRRSSPGRRRRCASRWS